MAILTVHHWTNARAGLTEMQRISRRQVVFTFDPDMMDTLWLVRDYLPEIIDIERQRATPISDIVDQLNADRIETVEIPHDCTDGFQGAYWRRPEEYLQAEVRGAILLFHSCHRGRCRGRWDSWRMICDQANGTDDTRACWTSKRWISDTGWWFPTKPRRSTAGHASPHVSQRMMKWE